MRIMEGFPESKASFRETPRIGREPLRGNGSKHSRIDVAVNAIHLLKLL